MVRMLTVEQMENMPDLSWVKQSYKKDESIIGKAKKQKWYDIKVTYGDGRPEKNTGIWAISAEIAKQRFIQKHYELSMLTIDVINS